MARRLRVRPKSPRYETRLFLGWPADVRRMLRDLAFHGESGMREAVSFHRNPKTCVAFVGKVPVGWALRSVGGWYPYGTPMVYVRRKFRRRGIASELVRVLVGRNRKALMFVDDSWNDAASGFWKSVKKRMRQPKEKQHGSATF